MKKIPLTQGKYALVDNKDFDCLNQFKWYFGDGYAKRSSRKNPLKKRGLIYMHRQILNTPKDKETDHVNHNTLDNRRSNLRIATHQQNMANSEMHKNNTSGSTGVYFNRRANKWCAAIQFMNKTKYLGVYIDIDKATEAYKQAATIYFGKFSRLNKI